MARLSILIPSAPRGRAWSVDTAWMVRRLAHGVSWTVTGQVTLRALTFLSTIVVARLLGTQGFGELGMVQSSVAMFGVMAGFGLGATATKYVAQWRSTEPDRASRAITVTTISATLASATLGVLVFLGADWIARAVLLQDKLALPLRAGAILFFVSSLDSVAIAVLRGFESFRRLAATSICRGVITPITAIPLVYLWGLEGAVWALIVNATLGLTVTTLMVRKSCQEANVPLRIGVPPRRDWCILLRFSLPAALAGMLVIPPAWIGRALLVRQPQGYVELALYSAAFQWSTLIMFIPSVIGAVLMPIVAASDGTEQTAPRRWLFIPVVFSAATCCVLGALCFLFADRILPLYGDEFIKAKPILGVMMLTTIFSAINEVLYQSLLGMGAPYVRLLASVIRASVFLGIAWVLVPHLLGMGLAISRLVAAAIYLTVQMPICLYVARRPHPGR